MDILLVGGAVRDMLLGRPVTDRDYLVVHADRETFQARYPTAALVGKSFPVFILDGSEYAWPRGGSLERDLELRDLTVNAMALERGGVLHAHPQALHDLQAGVLRPCSPWSMMDDPVRVFRAARFAAQFPDFSPSPELLEQMRAVARAGRLKGHSAERVGREVAKALGAARPSRFLELLRTTDCLLPWFEELAACVGVPAGPPMYHDKDVFGHTCQVMDRAAGDDLLVWMALVHDLGKALTPPENWPSHHGHEKLGARPARALGKRLRLPNAFIEAGATACEEHMRARNYALMRPGARVDLLGRLEAKRLTSRLFKLEAADSAGRPRDGQDGEPAAGQAESQTGSRIGRRTPDQAEGPDDRQTEGQALSPAEGLVAGRIDSRADARTESRPEDPADAPQARSNYRLARRDLRAIERVKLPEDKRDLGQASGEALRQLRCEALAAADAKR